MHTFSQQATGESPSQNQESKSKSRGNTGKEIIRMTLKGYDKYTQHKAP